MIPFLYEVNTNSYDKPTYKGIVLAENDSLAESKVREWYWQRHDGQAADDVTIHETIE